MQLIKTKYPAMAGAFMEITAVRKPVVLMARWNRPSTISLLITVMERSSWVAFLAECPEDHDISDPLDKIRTTSNLTAPWRKKRCDNGLSLFSQDLSTYLRKV